LFIGKEPLLAEYLRKCQISEKWLSLAQKTIDSGAFDFMDKWVLEPSSKKPDKFTIPSDSGRDDFQFNFANPFGMFSYGLLCNDFLFPWGSWPWSEMQQGFSFYQNRFEGFAAEANRLYGSPESGPLCSFVSGWLFLQTQPTNPGRVLFAELGLQRLDKKAFLKDCQPFLSKDRIVGQCLRKAFAAYRALGNEEVIELTSGFDDKDLRLFAKYDRMLRENPNKSFDKAAPELLGELWDDYFHEYIKNALQQIREGEFPKN
jgi:hypothetical protein